MINVSVYKQKAFPISTKKIKKVATKTLLEKGIVSDCNVSVAIVGQSEMDKLSQKYLHEGIPLASGHSVLAFSESETRGYFILPPGEKPQIGEIIISYPKAVEIAMKENKLIEDAIGSLVEHGALHLVGIHHE